jgi:hypothetical protein
MCGDESLVTLLSLGNMSLSGVFPEEPFAPVSSGDLDLLLCENCTLVQLGETFSAEEMYGDNYGYRSGLNRSMVDHLEGIVDYAVGLVELDSKDLVLDIGSNDGTLLRHYSGKTSRKIGMDPTASKFLDFYDSATVVVSDFFSKENFESTTSEKAKIITSIAMLYDLENPILFAKDVASCLADDGIWVAEQSYMPWMVLTGAYDTICHEHIEYYSLKSLEFLAARAGLKIVDAEINGANGGSIRVAFAHLSSAISPSVSVGEIHAWEKSERISSSDFFVDFAKYVSTHGSALRGLLEEFKSESKRIVALGASTKGSIVLQNAGLTQSHLDFIADVNPFKFGRYMSNSNLRIADEPKDLRAVADCVLILPWHFKETFEGKLADYLRNGGRIIWPLPAISIQNDKGSQTLNKMPALSQAAEEMLKQTVIY